MNVVYKNIKELKPYKNNAKKHPKEQVERIAESIRQFGFTQPVLIDRDNVVVAGHGRILGAKRAGLDKVPTVCMEDLTEEQIRAYRLIDNKLNESEWDVGLLNMEIDALKMFDMPFFGFLADEGKEQNGKYTRKINAPVYEIRGEKPVLSELFCIEKAKDLIEQINVSGVTEKEKMFLRYAAYRHIVFNYSKIAEYYANADEEMQELMEQSALVILDYNRALELGYVSLMNNLLEMNGDDEQNEL